MGLQRVSDTHSFLALRRKTGAHPSTAMPGSLITLFAKAFLQMRTIPIYTTANSVSFTL